jgi:hypothetical protein
VHTACESLERPWNATDAVVQGPWPVQRDNHIIDSCSDGFGLRIEEQSSSEKRDADTLVAKHPRQHGKAAVLLGFSAGKHYPTNTQVAKRRDLKLKIGNRKLFRIANLPDVAHHAVTIALIMRRNHDDRYCMDTMDVQIGTVDSGA